MPILQCFKAQKRNGWIVLRKWKSQSGSITYTTTATETIDRCNCFRMTSFGANIIREGVFMPTCKVKDTTHITNHSHQHNELQHIQLHIHHTLHHHTFRSYTVFFNKSMFAITDTRTNISFAWFRGANTR